MHDELETRLRAARDGLGGPSVAVTGRVATDLQVKRARRGHRWIAALRSRPARAIGATVAVACLIAVMGILLVNSSSSERPAAGEPTPVPDLTGKTLDEGYRLARAAGFAVSLLHWTTLRSDCNVSIREQQPAPGSQAPAGSSITLTPGACALTSLFSPSDVFPLEDFRGQTVQQLADWAMARGLIWEAMMLPPLRDAGAPRLLDNFIVASQAQPPGTPVRNGVLDGNSFRPTPIRVRAKADLSVARVEPLGLRLVSLPSSPGALVNFSVLSGRRSIAWSQIRGPVTVLVLTDGSCHGCPRRRPPWSTRLGVQTILVFADPVMRPIRAGWLPFPAAQTRLAVVGPRGRDSLPPSGFLETVLLDRTGRIAMRLAGAVNVAVVDRFVAELVNEPVPPIIGPVTALPLSRTAGPSVAIDQIPPLITPLPQQACPVDPGRIYLLTTSPDGKGRLYLARTHGDGVVVQVQWGASLSGGSVGCGSTSSRFYAGELRRSGVVSAGLEAVKRRGEGEVVTRFAYIVADGYSTATVAGRTYPIDGNGFMLQGRFAAGTVVTFRGPRGIVRRDLRSGRAP